MGAIVIRTRFDESTESAEVATSAWILVESSVWTGAGNCPEFGLWGRPSEFDGCFISGLS